MSSNRPREAFVVDFKPSKEVSKKRSHSNIKLRHLDEISKVLLKRRCSNIVDEIVNKDSDARRSSIASMAQEMPLVRRNTVDLNPISLKQTHQTKNSEKSS